MGDAMGKPPRGVSGVRTHGRCPKDVVGFSTASGFAAQPAFRMSVLIEVLVIG